MPDKARIGRNSWRHTLERPMRNSTVTAGEGLDYSLARSTDKVALSVALAPVFVASSRIEQIAAGLDIAATLNQLQRP